MPSTVRATVNGEDVVVPPGTLLLDFLATRGVEPSRIAVERNGDVVPRAGQSGLMIAPGDVFEVVHFVGGG